MRIVFTFKAGEGPITQDKTQHIVHHFPNTRATYLPPYIAGEASEKSSIIQLRCVHDRRRSRHTLAASVLPCSHFVYRQVIHHSEGLPTALEESRCRPHRSHLRSVHMKRAMKRLGGDWQPPGYDRHLSSRGFSWRGRLHITQLKWTFGQLWKKYGVDLNQQCVHDSR